MDNGYSDMKLPGLEQYSPEQLFFINFAQVSLLRSSETFYCVTFKYVHSVEFLRNILNSQLLNQLGCSMELLNINEAFFHFYRKDANTYENIL